MKPYIIIDNGAHMEFLFSISQFEQERLKLHGQHNMALNFLGKRTGNQY